MKPGISTSHNNAFVVPYKEAQAEVTILNSRFLAQVNYADSVDGAREYIAEIKRKHSSASHNVPAFIIGGAHSKTEFCSDDGEPQGTAGKPILAVVRGSGIGNIVIVVTRYFGGTLLGTGGLVKAYSSAAKLVLSATPRALLRKYSALAIDISYAYYDPLRKALEGFNAELVSAQFDERVTARVHIPEELQESFFTYLADLSSGDAQVHHEGALILRQPLQDNAVPSR